MGRSLTRSESVRIRRNRQEGVDVYLTELESIKKICQGRRRDTLSGLPQVIMQANIGGCRPDSDHDTDQMIENLQNSIIDSLSVNYAAESWIMSQFNESQIAQCTLSINGLPEAHPSPIDQ